MARPKQSRLVMAAPEYSVFKPYGRCCSKKQPVELQLDEYEAIRLLDYEGMQQTEAAEVMNVSRPTLTRIYNSARCTVARALAEGRAIVITGGNVGFAHYQEQKQNVKIMNQKIAIPTMDGALCPHFGHAPQVTVVTVTDNKVVEKVVLESPEHVHGALPRFIAAQGCTDVLCGGLGMGAVNMLNQLGIEVHGGAPALPVDQIVEMYLNGTIAYGDSSCHHDGCHGEGHHHHHHDGEGCHHGEGGCHHEG